MNYLFYAVLFMGALLLIVTLSSWFSTKRKINQYDASVSRTESFIKGIKIELLCGTTISVASRAILEI
ncbi:Uncharacterised protein [Aggregatibacter aphrophilus]|uniref:Uncharacterized protein n=1 Tax=Aggregatibacter aphrophilus TaxID=732 RepID=A0A336NBU1_AGGAP|nr:Uncharacterised protein [Aggregatibacter aphrophilus]